MAKVIMTCGKICSGKTTYAQKLRLKLKGVLLSVDEIMLALFDGNVGSRHDEYVERLEKYLFDKSAELIQTGINVILDLGLWTRAEREYARKFFSDRGIDCEIHFLNVSDSEWKRRIESRNALVSAGKLSAYYVDEGLAQKVSSIFEMPDRDETDVWIEN